MKAAHPTSRQALSGSRDRRINALSLLDRDAVRADADVDARPVPVLLEPVAEDTRADADHADHDEEKVAAHRPWSPSGSRIERRRALSISAWSTDGPVGVHAAQAPAGCLSVVEGVAMGTRWRQASLDAPANTARRLPGWCGSDSAEQHQDDNDDQQRAQ
jgi:hypothetical protein